VRRATAAAAALLALVLLVPTAARANNDDLQCGPGDRWCIGAFMKHGRRFLDVGGFEMKGTYQVCVAPPGAKETCRTFTLVRNGTGAMVSSVRFTKHFPHARHGRYAVRWLYHDAQLGRVLHFRHPA
jgi:hypothetical protein